MRNKRKIITAGLIIAGFLLLVALVVRPLLRFASSPERLQDYILSHGAKGILVFCLLIVLQTMSTCIPATPFQMAAGFAFGTLPGAILCDLSAAVGSTLAFCLGRRLGLRLFHHLFLTEQLHQIRWLRKHVDSNRVCVMIFLFPATPKDLLSWFAGFGERKVWQWTLLVLAARFPIIFLTALSGSMLGEKRYGMFWGILVLTLLLYLAGSRMYRKMKEEK